MQLLQHMVFEEPAGRFQLDKIVTSHTHTGVVGWCDGAE